MDLKRVDVLGGGPGGLYAARLLKLARPGLQVVVHEQDAPEETFGFGVGLAARTQDNLRRADPDSYADIEAAGWRHDMSMEVDGRRSVVHTDRLVGIARTRLLHILQDHAAAAGVELRFGCRRTAAEMDGDLVIAADGVASATRRAGDFGGHVREGRGLFLWCGAPLAIPRAVFAPVRGEHGTFVAHAYPYAADRSTFLIETDEATWRKAGYAATTDALAPGDSDQSALADLSSLFAGHLQGQPLLGNRTRWTRFRTVRCARWHDGRTVLLGDAAHTAHPSIGSGTKLAMEDAIALVQALDGAPDLRTALCTYEATRRGDVERLQELARRSQLWWESFPDRMHLDVDRLMVAYMTRAGNVVLPRFAGQSPHIVAGALAAYGVPDGDLTQDLSTTILDQPLTAGGVHLPGRVVDATTLKDVAEATVAAGLPVRRLDVSVTDPWDDTGDAVVRQARDGLGAGAIGTWLVGPPDRGSVLSRLDLAERVGLEAGGVTVVGAPASRREELAAGVLSGRCDLVVLEEG